MHKCKLGVIIIMLQPGSVKLLLLWELHRLRKQSSLAAAAAFKPVLSVTQSGREGRTVCKLFPSSRLL